MLELLLVGCSGVVVLLHGASFFLRALFSPRHAVARPVRNDPCIKFDLPIREEPFERACTPFKKKRAYGKHLYLPVLLVNQEAPILAGTMKIVLKVAITCKKCKTCVLRIASKIKGIKSLTFDEDKATLTVVGDVDVVEIVEALRKAKHPAVVDSVIDEKKEAEEKKKKEEEEKKKKEEEEKKKKEEEEKKKEAGAMRPDDVPAAVPHALSAVPAVLYGRRAARPLHHSLRDHDIWQVHTRLLLMKNLFPRALQFHLSLASTDVKIRFPCPLFLRISLLLRLTLVNFNFQTSENKCSFAARSMPLNLKIQMHRKKFQSSIISARIINAEVLIDKL